MTYDVENFVLKGKAKNVFRLIELMAMGEKAEKQQKTKEKKSQKWHGRYSLN